MLNEIVKTGILRNIFTNSALYYFTIVAINLLDYAPNYKIVFAIIIDSLFFLTNLISFSIRHPIYYERHFIDQLVSNVLDEYLNNLPVNKTKYNLN